MSQDDNETAHEKEIPLLEEVVSFDDLDLSDLGSEPESAQEEQPDADSAAFRTLPTHDSVIESIRKALHEQLTQELGEIIPPLVEQAIDQTTQQLNQMIQQELSGSLEERLTALIEKELDNQFGKQ